MKYGISTYSFHRLLESGSMDMFAVIEKVKEMGFEVIEFSGLQVPDEIEPLDFAQKVKQKCADLDLEVGNYTIGADFLQYGMENWEKEVDRLKGEIEIADQLGASGMRHDAAWGFPEDYRGLRSFSRALPVLIRGCRAVTEIAREYELKTMIENHGFFCQDSSRVMEVVNGVNDSNFGVLLDVGNFLCVDEKPVRAVGKLMPLAFHVHMKDFHVKSGEGLNPGQGWFSTRGGNYLRGAILGHGNVPLKQCLQIIKDSSYEGVLSLEFEGMEDPLQGIAISLQNLKRYLSS